MSAIAIVIPARYASTRFPGKPLANIGPKTMLQHTVESALSAARILRDVTVIVATEDRRIFDHAQTITGITPVMTADTCPTGSDRVLAALDVLKIAPDIVINLQGDAPFTPPHFLVKLAEALMKNPAYAVSTPAVRLTWLELDRLRENKIQTPFSGTTVIMDAAQQALWFSKNIIPAMRQEANLRLQGPLSPIYQHIGLYAYTLDALRTFVSLPESYYEKLEGLEQLRFLENGFSLKIEEVSFGEQQALSGVDTPEDLMRAERLWYEVQQ